jgi:hypothetical protein
MMELCEDYCLINCLDNYDCNSCLSSNDYHILELELKCESKNSLLSSFLANKPTSQKPYMIRGKVFLLDRYALLSISKLSLAI